MPQLILNTRRVALPAAGDTRLLDFLRDKQGLTAAKPSCENGDCSACLVLLGEIEAGSPTPRYRMAASCLLHTGQLVDCHVITPEGLNGPELSAVQQALLEQGGVQCGYCTPGLVIALTAALLNARSLTASASGNLCRCTGYAGIRRAIAALEKLQPEAPLTLLEAADRGLLPRALAEAAQELRPVAGEAARFPTQEAVIGGNTDWAVQHPHLVPGQRSFLHTHRQPAWRHITRSDSGWQIGAAVTLDELQQHAGFAADWPEVAGFLDHFASPAVRQQATLAGNLANASPIADMAVILLALAADVLLAGPDGQRRVPLSQFYTGLRASCMQPHEILESVRIMCRPAGQWRLHVEKIARREFDDIASVNSALLLGPGEKGCLGQARFSAGGIAPAPMLLQQTSDFLSGKALTVDNIRQGLRIAGEEIRPISDFRGQQDYKRRLLQHQLLSHLLAAWPELPFAACLP